MEVKSKSPNDFFYLRRKDEITRIIRWYGHFFSGKDLLEIGSGSGIHLQELASVCRSAEGIDIEVSEPARRLGVRKYDGLNLPFPNGAFDVVFSSNVLEHIKNEEAIHREMRRVLRAKGICIHIVPGSTWRIHASLLYYPDKVLRLLRGTTAMELERANAGITTSHVSRNLFLRVLRALPQRRHGEFGNWFTEHFLFRTACWKRRFESYGWHIESSAPSGIFGTGYDLLGNRLGWEARVRLAKILGSHSVVFVLR